MPMIQLDPHSLTDTACRRLSHMFGQHAQRPGPLRDFYHQLTEQLAAELDYRDDVLHQCEVDLDADADAEGGFLGDGSGLAAYAEHLQAELATAAYAEHADGPPSERPERADDADDGPPRLTGDGAL